MSQPEEKGNEERRVMHIFNQQKHGFLYPQVRNRGNRPRMVTR